MKEVWQKIVGYLFFKKQKYEEGKEPSFNLRAMHTINKISIFMFLFALLFILGRWIFRMIF